MKLQRSFDWFKLVTTSMFVIGIGLVLFFIFSLIFFNERYFNERLPTLAFDSDAPTGSQRLPKRYVFSENTSQSYQENILVENEDDFETASDVSVDSMLDELADDFELEPVSENLTDALSPEVRLKTERYAKLAQILPVIEELRDRKFKLTKQYGKYIEEHYRRLRLQGGPYPEPDPAVEEEYQAAVKVIDKEVSDYNRQIDNMFPELDITYEEPGIDYIFVFRKDQVLREYFGKKLPFDGNLDYFSSE